MRQSSWRTATTARHRYSEPLLPPGLVAALRTHQLRKPDWSAPNCSAMSPPPLSAAAYRRPRLTPVFSL
ncbi:hypothetical protein AURDEDRAFT_177853 [Auricularia subglabra TFB-10046 SS5]|uniref:Uncharacterized protein n=1 Tax=Auricularia subglabra (strain TFB-10046 / SS5) TaxID=717982 RepID=J0L9M0_AURST|nr:hypothetical protein AURDEDRAFT_177853 [Auricularia subglabra TFB-10046 SS5]